MKPITRPARTSLGGQTQDPAPGGPLVSVVIPTRNRASIVFRAIDSVLRQTFSDFELIVVDDASTDNTREAVRAVADPRARLIALAKNAGQAHAENAGIAAARGEWVAFLDDDDEWLPDKLERQLARLRESPEADAVYCRCLAMTSEGLRGPRARSDMAEGDITSALLNQRMPITPTAYMARRSRLLEAGGFDESLPASADFDMWLRLSQAGCRFVAVQEPPLAIYHAEGTEDRVTTNAVSQAIGFATIERRWGPLMRARAGVEHYERWVHNRWQKLERAHRKLARKLTRSGSRSDALRYARSMRRALPWSWPFVAQALAVVLFGRLPYRLSRVRQGKVGAPWLRRLFGAG